MNILDLFSGIGGFSLGLERAGMKTIAFCEKDKYCQKVLRKHWPEIPIFEDITKLKGEMIDETIGLVCGGFPCQPFSYAGKRKGKEDVRHLWAEMFRIICETNPSWIIGENVNGIINMELEQVCANLESEDYEVQPFIIPACAVNAPHRRDRVWIIAHSTGKRCDNRPDNRQERHILRDGNRNATESESERDGRKCRTGEINTNVADTGSIKSRGVSGFQWKKISEIGGKNCNREWDENWLEVATRLCGMDARIPSRMDRLKCLGNSVVPQIVEIIGNYIMGVERTSKIQKEMFV